ncbi:MAG TPA: cytochrome P460 family protein [Puia sp.]|nr:cytochrome P460 family protein [Puia sp.]
MTGKKTFSKKWSVLLLLLLVCGVAIQFIRPGLGSPPVTADLAAPPEVKQILERACYNCHSNKTNLTWFDQVVPAYWLVRADILEARKALNFSEWDSLSKDQQKGKLFEALNKIQFKEMPLPQYRFLHSGANITEPEIAVLRNYLDTLAPVNTADPKRDKAGNDQYAMWTQEGGAAGTHAGGDGAGQTLGGDADGHAVSGSGKGSLMVKPALNGIAYIPEYKDWEVISTTDRFDNGTLRAILGNEIAVRAIKEHHINPWPDGTQFAKVAWDAVLDSTGQVHAGEFKQVEFMIRDSHKYADTQGWGWARWKGMQLQPYGKTATFMTECTSCHKPMKENDYVFTMPRNLRSDVGSADSLAFNPLDWKIITSSLNKKDMTMATLYGNELAVKSARKGAAYPAGAVIALVSWKQSEDEHWFGGRIPGTVLSIERVSFNGAGAGSAPYGQAKAAPQNGMGKNSGRISYEKYVGTPLTRSVTDSSPDVKSRIAYLAGQKASVMP